ncbi:MAG: hypothetical protein KME52_06465 [Desmonostoc geniculatum HA4340-LM1]|nr:hypothetical protein [Desmonostoc geniculatum HA4340-LM1]
MENDGFSLIRNNSLNHRDFSPVRVNNRAIALHLNLLILYFCAEVDGDRFKSVNHQLRR